MSLFDLLRQPSEETPWAFLERWHGAPTREPAPIPAGDLPESVRAFAARVTRWPDAMVQNDLANDPDDMRDGDKRVFFVENQGVYLWATDGKGADPVVWGRFNEPGERWQAEREPLSGFLLQIVVFEAILGSDHGALASWIPFHQLAAVLGPMKRLPLGSWRWPSEPGWFFASDDALAFVCPNGRWPGDPSDHFDVWIAARTSEPLARLSAIAGVRWDREPG
jgi:hypothetical protein